MSNHFPGQPPLRGEVYFIDFNPARGSEQAGHRPGVVISEDVGNRVSPTVIIAAITKTVPKKAYPQCVGIPPGVAVYGTVLCNQVTTVSKERLERFVCDLPGDVMRAIDAAISFSLDLR